MYFINGVQKNDLTNQCLKYRSEIVLQNDPNLYLKLYSEKTTRPDVVSPSVWSRSRSVQLFSLTKQSYSVGEETPVKYAEFIEDRFPWFVQEYLGLYP